MSNKENKSSAMNDGNQQLTAEKGFEAINRILAEFAQPAVKKQLDAAKAHADGELDLVMLNVVPLLFEIQGHVMSSYGFEADDAGFAAFAAALQRLESNADFAKKAAELKQITKFYTKTGEKKMERDDDDDADADDDNDADDGDGEEAVKMRPSSAAAAAVAK